MKKNIRRILLLLLVVIASYASYQVGLSHGFGIGASYEVVHAGPASALNNVSVLRLLREGEVQDAINYLETILDGNIIVYRGDLVEGALPVPYRNIFPNAPDAEKKIMAQVAKYRITYPSQSTVPEVQRSVSEVVDKYAPQKDHPER